MPFAQQIFPVAQQIWSPNVHLLSRFFHLVSRFSKLASRFSHLVTKFGPRHLVYTIWSTFGQQLGTPDIVNSTQAQVIQFPLSLEFQTEWEVSGEHFQHVPLATCTPSFHETLSFRASLNPHQKMACLRVLGFPMCHCPTWRAEDYFFVLDLPDFHFFCDWEHFVNGNSPCRK